MNTDIQTHDEILVVDDTTANLKLLEDILVGAGYHVRLATDGELALRSAKSRPPALVLLDIRMPGVDGYEVCQRLKEDEKTRSIPVIFLSILENEQEKVKAFQVGGVDFINKPIRAAEVLARVKTHLSLRHAQQDLETRNVELEAARETLEERVKERSAELEKTNRKLQQQIDDHLHTMEALRESESKYRSLIREIQTAIIVHDDQGQLLDSNPLAHELLGFSEDQLRGRSLIDPDWHFLREDGSVMLVAEYPVSLVLSTRQPLRGYVAGIRRSEQDEITWVLVNAIPEFNGKGEISQVIVSFVDITEPKRMEEVLKEKQKLLLEAQRLAHIGSWEQDLIKNELIGSDEIYRIFEINPDKFGGNPEAFLDAVHPDDREAVDFAYANSLKTRTPCAIDHRILLPDGSVKYLYAQIETYYEGDKPVRSVGTTQDITNRKMIEEELSQHRDHLEELVQERTLELKTANKELEGFAYSVSHDLRAPLRHIDGFIGLLQKKEGVVLDEESRHYMAAISDSANKMGQLIDDLLSFSRLGRLAMSLNRINLKEMVQNVIEELDSDTRGRECQWRISELPTVYGDASLLRIVLTNLLSNAVKFSSIREQAKIEVGCQVNEKENTIFVSDNGAGFDPAYADNLFGVFQRLHHADEFEGTGVGLAIAQQIVHRHGGRIWAESELGKGATFYFSLLFENGGKDNGNTKTYSFSGG